MVIGNPTYRNFSNKRPGAFIRLGDFQGGVYWRGAFIREEAFIMYTVVDTK